MSNVQFIINFPLCFTDIFLPVCPINAEWELQKTPTRDQYSVFKLNRYSWGQLKCKPGVGRESSVARGAAFSSAAEMRFKLKSNVL